MGPPANARGTLKRSGHLTFCQASLLAKSRLAILPVSKVNKAAVFAPFLCRLGERTCSSLTALPVPRRHPRNQRRLFLHYHFLLWNDLSTAIPRVCRQSTVVLRHPPFSIFKMPPPARPARLVRRRPLSDRLQALLNPMDFYLWVSEEIQTLDWDSTVFGTRFGLIANFVFLLARANSGGRQVADDVFNDAPTSSWVTVVVCLDRSRPSTRNNR